MGVVADAGEPAFDSDTAMEALIPIVTRVVRARVADASLAEDLVQETLVRVLARANRVAPGMLEPYAIVTARTWSLHCGPNATGNDATSIASSRCRGSSRRMSRS